MCTVFSGISFSFTILSVNLKSGPSPLSKNIVNLPTKLTIEKKIKYHNYFEFVNPIALVKKNPPTL